MNLEVRYKVNEQLCCFLVTNSCQSLTNPMASFGHVSWCSPHLAYLVKVMDQPVPEHFPWRLTPLLIAER